MLFPFSFFSSPTNVSQIPLDPSSISGLKLWLKADAGIFSDAGTTPAVNLGTIQQWNDQSGVGMNMTQTTLSLKPTKIDSGQNGLPIVRFDGVNDLMDGTFPASISQPDTIFFACNVLVVTPNIRLFDGSVLTRQLMYSSSPGNLSLTADGGGTLLSFSSGSPSGFMVLTIVANGISSIIRKNASQVASGNIGGLAMPTFRLANSHSTAEPGQVDFGEVLVYSGVVSLSDMTNIENYLKQKWGTP